MMSEDEGHFAVSTSLKEKLDVLSVVHRESVTACQRMEQRSFSLVIKAQKSVCRTNECKNGCFLI